MNNYSGYEITDWLEDVAFQRWVYHGEKDTFFRSLVAAHPHQWLVMEEAKGILLNIRGDLDPISTQEISVQVRAILNEIPDENEQGSIPWWKQAWLRGAAVLVIAAGLGFGIWKQNANLLAPLPSTATLAKAMQAGKVEMTNNSAGIRLVNLPDGSSVVLKSHARITFPAHFDADRREVSMSGEAFFEVVKNPAQPFFVYAGSMVTKVKGTSFSIKANDGDDEVNLVVKTGIVEVSAASRKVDDPVKKLTLVPNEQVTFNQKNFKMTTRSVQQPILLDIPAEKQDLTFRRTPLSEVFAALENTYGVDIRYDKAAVAHCTITARLGDEPISEKLEMICSVVNARFETRNDIIQVTTPGCE